LIVVSPERRAESPALMSLQAEEAQGADCHLDRDAVPGGLAGSSPAHSRRAGLVSRW